MAIIVRNFEKKDADRAAEIIFESFKGVFKERWSEEQRESAAQWQNKVYTETPSLITATFVAEENDMVIGVLHISANIRFGLGILHCIGVDPGFAGKGVGKALAAEAELLWKKHRMRKVYTCTSHINTKALRYYKSLGFIEEGVLKNHFFEGIDEIQLAKFYTYNN